MRKNMWITNVVITEQGPVVVDRRRRSKYRIVRFVDLADNQQQYTLCIMNGHPGAARFERLPVGTKLSRVVVYTEKQRNYVDGNSNFSIIKAQPLF